MKWYDPLEKYLPEMPKFLRQAIAAIVAVCVLLLIWQVVT